VLSKNLTKQEDQGYIGLVNTGIIKATVATLHARKGRMVIKWIKGHSGHERNEGADWMANLGALKNHAPDEPDLIVPPPYWITGAKLSKLTQSLAYKGI